MGLARRVRNSTMAAGLGVAAAAMFTALGASSSGIVSLTGGLVVAGGVAVAGGVGIAAVALATRPSLSRLAHLDQSVRRMRTPEGRDLRLSELPYGDGARLAASINALMDDVRAELRVREGDARLLASLIENSPNGVLVCGHDGRIRAVNPAFRAMFEFRGDPVGRLPNEVLSVPEIQELVDLARRGEGEDASRMLSDQRHVYLRPIVTEGGQVAILAQDFTRFRAAERARTDFIANVSHELRTPMAAILGYADALMVDLPTLPQDSRPLVEGIARNSRRMRDTFEGLLHLARVEARARELSREALRLEPLIVEAIVPAVDQAMGKGLDFELDCPEELAATTNAEALEVILANLVTNAVKYTPAPGWVKVAVRAVGSEVLIEVTDSGIGIDAAHQDRIFERFFRVDEGRAREVGGTGLGLAMVKHLALATGARVGVRSAVGRGSTFTVTLPRAEVAE